MSAGLATTPVLDTTSPEIRRAAVAAAEPDGRRGPAATAESDGRRGPAATAESDGRRGSAATDVLRCVLDHGPVARSTIGRLTGLSAAAVSRRCADLADLGLLRDRPLRVRRGAIGRPHVPVDIDTRRHLVSGVHIALWHATFVLMDLRGRVLAQERVPHHGPVAGEAATAFLDDLGGRMAGFLARHAGDRRPLGVGVATGGWVDPARGVVVRHPQLRWREVAVGAVLQARLGLPVRVESHSRALARAEQLLGDHRDRSRASLVHLFVGNVVDAAIATGGTVHHGPGSAAGDVSHLPVGEGAVLPAAPCSCGRTGCAAATLADRSVARYAADRGLLPPARFEDATTRFDDTVAALERGEAWATEVFRDRARLVGRAVALLLDVINPEILVVVEAGVVRSPDLLAAMHDEIARRSHIGHDPRATVVAGSFGVGSLGVAAGSIVLHEIYSRPRDVRPVPAAS